MNFGSLAKPVGDVFTGRFFLVSYLPTYAATLFILVLVWAGAPSRHVQFSRAWETASALSVGELVLLAIAITLASFLVHPLQLALVRFLEGYWPRWLEPMARPLLWNHRRRRARLAKAAELPADPTAISDDVILVAGIAGTQLRRRYPIGMDARPTSLGNVLMAMEVNAGSKYGWDAVVAWPRLYPVLGDRVREIVDDRRNTMDAAARLSAVATVTGVAAGLLLIRSGWWILLALIPLLSGWLAYRGAVQAAIAYGEAVEVAFDLHRFELLKALHLPLPPNRQAEQQASEDLSSFWRQGKPIPLSYDHGES